MNARDDLDYWFDDDCSVCQPLRKMEEENRSPTLDETHEAFKKAKKQGAWVGGKLFKEPPEPKEFPLYLEVEKWNKSVMGLGDIARALGEFWIYTEEAADLFWYANTLMAKTYRQLCNKWHIKTAMIMAILIINILLLF